MQPLTLHIQLMTYRIKTNDFIAKTKVGESFVFDPFVACSILMSDEEYEAGKGIWSGGLKIKINYQHIQKNTKMKIVMH